MQVSRTDAWSVRAKSTGSCCLPATHELDFVSDSFGFRQSLKVSIPAGRGAPVSLTIPRVAMNINALPWAEVFVDGARIGDTPLANVHADNRRS